jgi:glycosyltransferase involved in cell wall biosynthesis
VIKRLVKTWFTALGIEIRRVPARDPVHSAVVSLKPKVGAKGNVLLAYIVEPFLRSHGVPISNAHSHDWESFKMARIFLEMDYNVDVISYLNSEFIPEKNYSIFVSARTYFDLIAARLNHDCIKIVHQDTAHWIYNNQSAYTRLLDVQRRRGFALNSVRIIEQNWAMENADCAVVLGNEFTIDTFRYAGKKIYRVPVSVPVVYDWPTGKDFDTCRKYFLWFGSAGFVHKGLDLVLEAFSQMPDLHLTVCGPLEEDEKFRSAYHKELYETANIHAYGWIDVGSEEFINVAKNCIALVYPSCSEGGGSSVLTCMHAGMIPVITYESSVSIRGFGVMLEAPTIDAIKSAARWVSQWPVDQCRDNARRAWEFARRDHSREKFAENYTKIIKEILREGG